MIAASGKQIKLPSSPINPTILLGPHGPHEPPVNSANRQTAPPARSTSADRIHFDTA